MIRTDLIKCFLIRLFDFICESDSCVAPLKSSEGNPASYQNTEKGKNGTDSVDTAILPNSLRQGPSFRSCGLGSVREAVQENRSLSCE